MAKSLKELKKQYIKLGKQEARIPERIEELTKKTKPISKEISKLKNKAHDIDVEISKKPARVDKKACNCAFLCMGSHCKHYQAPNPDIGKEQRQRNAIIAKANRKQEKINDRFKKIENLSDKRINLEKQQINLREKMINKRKRIASEPISILGLLGLKKKPTMAEQAAEEEKVRKAGFLPPNIMKYGAIALGVGLLFSKVKKKEKK